MISAVASSRPLAVDPGRLAVVASDVWGTVLAKQDGQQLQLAMAEFAEAPAVPG